MNLKTCHRGATWISLNVLHYGLPVATVYIPLLSCVGSEPIDAVYRATEGNTKRTSAFIQALKHKVFSRRGNYKGKEDVEARLIRRYLHGDK